NAFVADFMGFQNIFAATVVSTAAETMIVEIDGIGARVEVESSGSYAVGDPLLVAFRADHAVVSLEPDVAGAVAGTVRTTVYLGSSLRVLVETAAGVVRAQIDERDFERYGPDDLAPGRAVSLVITPSHLVALPSPDSPAHSEPIASTMAT